MNPTTVLASNTLQNILGLMNRLSRKITITLLKHILKLLIIAK